MDTNEVGRITPFGFGEPETFDRPHVPTARIAPLRRVAWRDDPASTWRFGSTDRSENPVDGEEFVDVYEYETGEMLRFVGDEIDRLRPEPIVRGSGGRSTKRIG